MKNYNEATISFYSLVLASVQIESYRTLKIEQNSSIKII